MRSADTKSTPICLHVERNKAWQTARHRNGRAPAFVRERGDLGKRMEDANLIVRRHRADEQRVCANRVTKASRSIRPSRSTPRYVTRKPSLLECPAGIENGAVSVATVTMCRRSAGAAPARPLIARLFDSVAPLVNTTSRKRAPISVGDLLARLLDRLAGLPAKGMISARRIAEVLRKKRQHRVEHARIDRSRGMGIEVDRFHGQSTIYNLQTTIWKLQTGIWSSDFVLSF